MRRPRSWSHRTATGSVGGDDAPSSAPTAAGVDFRTFAVFYMVAFLLDATEEWEPEVPALLFILAVVVLVLRGLNRWTFLGWLVATSAYILLVHFPDPGNHNNLYLLFNVFMGAGILYGSRPGRAIADDSALLETLKPVLRASLALVYLLAGFHKLNEDFFEPVTGCAHNFVLQVWDLTPFPALSLPLGGVVAIGAGVIAWEIGAGLLLWLRRAQPFVLIVCLVSHAVLAMIRFTDFSSFAFALLLLFIPDAWWRLLRDAPSPRLGRLGLDRLGLYVGINVGMALAAGAYYHLHGWQRSPWPGLALDAAMIVFLWPIIRRLLRRGPRPRWLGVPMWTGNVPRWAIAVPLLVVFLGLNPYLGLRTGGTFNMFSNLQIEGDRSNHLLLGSNPFAVWDLQDDAVHVIDIDPRHIEGRGGDLADSRLPMLEFEKRIVRWKRDGLEGLYATFEYEGRRYRTDDVVRDNPFSTDGYRPVHYLVDFVPVQGVQPAVCTW